MINRDTAYKIVDDNIPNKNLVKHCLAVEAAMGAIAKHFGEDAELWSRIGLLHDADWDATRNDMSAHTRKTVEWIKEHGDGSKEDEIIIRTILSHNHERNGEPGPENNLEWALYTCDELTGIITATALVMPDKKLADVTPESVLKKFNSKSFAAAVDRNQIKLCHEKLGISIEEYVAMVLTAMQGIHQSLGL